MTSYDKYLAVVVPAMAKSILGPLAGVALHLSWWQTMICSITGMMTRVILFTFLGKAIGSTWQKMSTIPPKRFSARSRRAVSSYQKFGIVGVACLSPLFLTPIGGTLMATSFKVAPVKIILWMSIFALFWGAVMTLAIYHIPGLPKVL